MDNYFKKLYFLEGPKGSKNVNVYNITIIKF